MNEEELVSLPPMWVDPGEASGARAAIFVSDPSAEAERIAQQLRAAGYLVVDVPLSMLVARVAVQTPSVVLVDADAEGVREVVANARTAAEGGRLEILYLGQPRVDDASIVAEELSGGASAFFARPVEAASLLRKVEALSGGPASRAGPSSNPRSARPLSIPSVESPLSIQPPPAASSERDVGSRAVRLGGTAQATLSPELEALMAEAEQRVGAQMASDAGHPTPEEEIEAVLPAALLAALDEPLDDESAEDDEALADTGHPPPASPSYAAEPAPVDRAPPSVSARTSAGRLLTPFPPSMMPSPGVAYTLAVPAVTAAEGRSRFPELPQTIAPRPLEPRPEPVSSVPATLVGPEDVPRRLAEAIASRVSGCLTIESTEGLRRVVLRDGDIVAAASSAEDETLVVFLTTRGDLRREQGKELVGKVPPFGRHAGAALIGHGLLRQDQLWPTLRAHAEWVLGRVLRVARGTSRIEAEAPGRLGQEPSVFGGSSGAEVMVEAIRRVVSPEEALRRLGGRAAIVVEGPSQLLSECALDANERSMIEGARGVTLGDLAGRSTGSSVLSALYAINLLGVIVVASADTGRRVSLGAEEIALPGAGGATSDALDLTVVRERVRARLELVCEADYFTLLGISREATGYEVRRAYLELRRGFEPARILTPEVADLEGDVRAIVVAIDEAYEILRDGVRRERYRRALGAAPGPVSTDER